MKIFLGVDGGQSSTTALVGDEHGRVIGVGRAGPCNHAGAAEGRDKFVRALNACVSETLTNGGVAHTALGDAAIRIRVHGIQRRTRRQRRAWLARLL